MADNYIEKQYEQYEARKAAWEKARKQGTKKTGTPRPLRPEPPGEILLDADKKESACNKENDLPGLER